MKNLTFGIFGSERSFFGYSFTIAIILLLATDHFAQNNELAPPANDSFANAQQIGVSGGTINGTNVLATKQPGEPAHADNKGGASIWYRYTADGGGVLNIDTKGTVINTLLAVYVGNSINELSRVAQNDDIAESSDFSYASKVTVGLKDGDSIYIAVDSKNINGTPQTGAIVLNVSFQTAVANDLFANAAELHYDRGVMHSTTNVGATKEPGEPNHAGNIGGRSVWYTWTNPNGHEQSMTFTVAGINTATHTSLVASTIGIYTGNSVDQLSPVQFQIISFARMGRITFKAMPGTTYRIALDGWNTSTGAAQASYTITYGPTKSKKQPDLDGDGRTDVSVFRPSTGTFLSLDTALDQYRATQWGTNGDVAMYNEWETDPVMDRAIYRPSTGTWYIYKSLVGHVIFPWGIPGDVPLLFNRYFPNSGNHTLSAVFRPGTGTWWIESAQHGPTVLQFGQDGDIPMAADMTGDGSDEAVIFRPSNGTWYIAKPFTGEFVGQFEFGQPGDIPVPADYDGDGFAELAIYRPSTGTWWFRNRHTGAHTAQQFGLNGDKPQPGDYDGDGRDDIAIYRNGAWWIRESRTGSVKFIQFGTATDVPISYPLR